MLSMRLALTLSLALLLAACAAPPAPSQTPERLRFALVGDAPYTPAEVPRWAALLQSVGQDGNAFLLHVGDIKGGSEPCSDMLLAERIAQLQQLPLPVLLTPGDNEWTDCHRKPAGAFNPLERLAHLRRLAYPDPQRSLGARPMAVQSQASSGGLPEHQAFEQAGVRFASLHVVGSNNGLEPWGDIGDGRSDSRAEPRPERIAAVRAREAAVRSWMRQNFERAASSEVDALVLWFQANPGFEARPGSERREGFDDFLAELRELTARLKKPVLLLHGDWHEYLADRPWPEQPWVQRVQTFGSPKMGSVRVRVLAGMPLRFEFDAQRAP